MTIYIGADHGGFALKEKIKKALMGAGQTVMDCGNAKLDPIDDFPIFAKAVAEKVAANPSEDRGIVICRSGFGVDIVANRVLGVRSALAASEKQIKDGRGDDDVNVLALPADFMDEATALAIVQTFLTTPFDGDERFVRRIKEIDQA
jgi:RpiB/LacA/LacB family sugar-phosphate isomerase